jgi:catechol 2,3-dioxygenase-like lactoylglutathione lyase family enzyme
MDYEKYRKAYFVQPAPEKRYHFVGAFATTLYYEDYREAIAFYERVLGLPSYVEGDNTRGWPIGDGWLTLLRGTSGNPQNVEITLEVRSVVEAEALQGAFIAAGAQGQMPSNELMYRPVRACPIVDPFGLEILIIALLDLA